MEQIPSTSLFSCFHLIWKKKYWEGLRISNSLDYMSLIFFSICLRLKFNDSNNWLFCWRCMVTAQVQRGAHPPPEATSWSSGQTKEKVHKMQILLGKITLFISQYLPLHNLKQKSLMHSYKTPPPPPQEEPWHSERGLKIFVSYDGA